MPVDSSGSRKHDASPMLTQFSLFSESDAAR